ncbi:MAG: PAS domain S-box protein [Bacteroidales bacterium]|nr:PAS domain S-box protein [Bacteroidales bacterium]
MFNLNKILTSISNIGITPEMTSIEQKGIILLNRILFGVITFFGIISIISYIKLDNPIIGNLFLLNVLISIVCIVLNYTKKSKISKYLISFFIPVSLVLGGAYAKSIGVTDNLILYLSPRILITVGIIIPLLIFNYSNFKTIIIAMIPGILSFIFYDKIHQAFGVQMSELHFESEYYNMYIAMITLFLLFIIASVLFLKNVNIKFDKQLRKKIEQLKKSERNLLFQNEKIVKYNTDLTEQKRQIVLKNKQIEAQRKQFEEFVYVMPEIVLEADFKGKLTYVNNRFFGATGYNQKDFEDGIVFTDLFQRKDRLAVFRNITKLLKESVLRNYEIKIVKKNGTTFTAMLSLAYNENDIENSFKGIMLDVSEKVYLQSQLLKLNTAVEQSENSIVITDTTGLVEYVNPKFEELSGYKTDKIIGKKLNILKSGKHDELFYKNLWETIVAGKVWQGTLLNKKKNGELYYEESTITPIKDTKNNITSYIAIKQDITERIENEKQLIEAFEIITEKNEKITKSINYAKMIQAALMPSANILLSFFNSYFVLNEPRDIVGGDFYYVADTDKHVIFALADSTGHGVPGGFMSMLGITFLEDIIKRQNITTPNLILEKLRSMTIKSLDNNGNIEKTKDGFDISLCTVEKQNLNMQFSGAFQTTIIIRDTEIFRIKGNQMPVGTYLIMDFFANHTFQLKKDDVIYLFSDGYEDQFGGEKNTKFMKLKLINLFLQISDKPMKKQKEILLETFNNWKNSNQQTDDTMIFGVKI